MADTEKKHEEEEDLQTKDCSLSIDNWMTVLSSEINRNVGFLSHLRSIYLNLTLIFIAILVGYFAFLMDFFTILMKTEVASTNLTAIIESSRLFIYITMVGWFSLIISVEIWGIVTQERINTLERIRDDAIFRNSDLKKICKRWEQYRNAKFLYFLSYFLKKALKWKSEGDTK